jgi:hypothetical protein
MINVRTEIQGFREYGVGKNILNYDVRNNGIMKNHNLYSSPESKMIKSKRTRHIWRVRWKAEKCIEMFNWDPEGQISLGRPRCRRKYNTKIYSVEVKRSHVDCINMAMVKM